MSRSFRISALVFSSTQLIGLSSVGLESHTSLLLAMFREGCGVYLTCVNFSPENHDSASYSRLHHRAVLSVIIYDLILSILDVLPGSVSPGGGKQA